MGCLQISGHAAWVFRRFAARSRRKYQKSVSQCNAITGKCGEKLPWYCKSLMACLGVQFWNVSDLFELGLLMLRVPFAAPSPVRADVGSLFADIHEALPCRGIARFCVVGLLLGKVSLRCRLDACQGYPWRMDWGGHDPATPVAEMWLECMLMHDDI